MTWKARAARSVDRDDSAHWRVAVGADGLGDGVGLGDEVGLGDGVGLGDEVGLGDGLGLGEGLGDGVGVAAIVGLIEALAWLDGAGDGVEPDGSGVLEQATMESSAASTNGALRTGPFTALP
jgi:hypothetical protein